MPEKLKGFLGLAVRAGMAAPGGAMALDAIRSGRAGVVLIDERASDNTRKKLVDACVFRRVRWAVLPAGWIADACGKGDLMAVCVRKGGLADRISELTLEN